MAVLLETNFAVVLFCADCGKLQMNKVSLFALKATGGKQIVCACGKPLGRLRAVGRSNYELSAPCPLCGDTHGGVFSREIFTKRRLYNLSGDCPVARAGFAGRPDIAKKELTARAGRLKECLTAAKTEEDSVINPQIMFEVINKLDDLAARGDIYCGQCGNGSVGVEILADFVRLFCDKCGCTREVKAINQDDVKSIGALGFIELLPDKWNLK